MNYVESPTLDTMTPEKAPASCAITITITTITNNSVTLSAMLNQIVGSRSFRTKFPGYKSKKH